MKVLHLIDSGGLYGAEKVILHLARCQADNGLDPTIGVMSGPDDPPKPIEGAAAELGIKFARFPAWSAVDLKFHGRLTEWILRQGVGVLHLHGYRANILANLAPISRRKGYVTVTTLHGYTHVSVASRMACIYLVDQVMALRSDAIVGVSRKLQKSGPIQWAREKTYFIPNGIPDVSECAADPSLTPLIDFVTARPTFLSVGRLSPEKSQSTAIGALSKLCDVGHDAQLLILGEGPQRDTLQFQIDKAGLAERIRMPGYVANASSVMRFCAAMLITSTTEGLPITLLEAMQNGLPIVSTPVGEIPSVLGGNAGGWIFEVGNVSQLTEALVGVLESPDEVKRRRCFAMECQRSNYSVEVTEKSYRSLYVRLMTATGEKR